MLFLIRCLLFMLLLSAFSVQAAVIMLYHHVDAQMPPATSVTPEQFENHLTRLEAEGFAVVRLDELIRRVRAGEDPDQRLVSITFDDAYASVHEAAAPLLEKRGWHASVFVATGAVLKRQYATMTTAQLQDLHRRGHLVLNHGHSHDHLVRARPGETDAQRLERAKADILTAQDLLTTWLGESPARFFAYPYGETDPSLQLLLEEMGFLGFSQRSGALGVQTNWQDIPRVPVNYGFSGWNSLRDKLQARPLPVDQVVPLSGITDDARPELKLFLDKRWQDRPINCFVAGTPAQMSSVMTAVQRMLVIVPAQDLRPGRTLVNCTSPAGNGRFFWHSWLWMKRDNGHWYDEP